METVKKILEYILIGIGYLFKGVWIVIKFIFKWIWKGVVWMWEWVVLVFKTPTTASGNLDRRFRTTRIIENKNKGCVCAFLIVFLIFGLICLIFAPKNSTEEDSVDTVRIVKEENGYRKKQTKTEKATVKTDIQDSMIDLHFEIKEAVDEELEDELDETPCVEEAIIDITDDSPIDSI